MTQARVYQMAQARIIFIQNYLHYIENIEIGYR